jgi:hypothetical protein
MLELERDPNPIVSADVDTEEDPEEETEELEQVEMDEEGTNAEEDNEDPGEGEVVESVPVVSEHARHKTPSSCGTCPDSETKENCADPTQARRIISLSLSS